MANSTQSAKQTFFVWFVADVGRNVFMFRLIPVFLSRLCFLVAVILLAMRSIPLPVLIFIHLSLSFSLPLFIFVLLGLLGLFAAIAVTAGCRRRGRGNVVATAGGSGGGDGGCRDSTGGEGWGGSRGNWLAGWARRVAAGRVALRGVPTYRALVQGQILWPPTLRRAGGIWTRAGDRGRAKRGSRAGGRGCVFFVLCFRRMTTRWGGRSSVTEVGDSGLLRHQRVDEVYLRLAFLKSKEQNMILASANSWMCKSWLFLYDICSADPAANEFACSLNV